MRSQTANLDYLALGDWHGTLEIAPKTWYAGTPEPDRFRANEPGNVLLVELSGRGSEPQIAVLPIGKYSWHQMSLDLIDDEGIKVLEGQLGSTQDPETTLVRLKLSGACLILLSSSHPPLLFSSPRGRTLTKTKAPSIDILLPSNLERYLYLINGRNPAQIRFHSRSPRFSSFMALE